MIRRNPFCAGAVIILLLAVLTTCAGCGKQITKAEKSGFFFDTAVSIQVNAVDADQLAEGCYEICSKMELVLSAHNEKSELYAVNHRTEASVEISDDLRDCMEKALHYCELSDGILDITIYPVSSLWDFHAEAPVVPEADEINEALRKVDYRKVHLDGNTLTFDSPDTMIDLGAVAKGYISGKLSEYLKENGCTSALINLGGNVRTVGSKPDGSSWKIGIQKPFSDRGEISSVEEVKDACVITSGTYERTFTYEGKLYHHILDPKTGWPAETDLTSVSIRGTDDEACDAMATIAMIAGRECSEEIIKAAGLDVTVKSQDETGVIEEWLK